jgi:hypothetical protein
MAVRSRRPESPRDCSLFVAVPLTRGAFVADVADRDKDFVRAWASGFPGYPVERLWDDYRPIAAYASAVVAEASAAGVTVPPDATFEAWNRLTRGPTVITIFAHLAEQDGVETIEYRDAAVSVDAVCAALPADFAGVLDFTICYSASLIATVKRERPRCTVIANREKARLDVRLAIYRQTLRILVHEPMTYVEAAARVRLAALEAL